MDANKTKALGAMVEQLRQAGGDSLTSVILYGAEACGDHYQAAHDLHLLIVLSDLELATLDRFRGPIAHWLKKGHPMPRFFSPGVIADATDVFPIEFFAIVDHHRVLHGADSFADLQVNTQHLRLQCERELREKLMRLQEAYIESRGRKSELERLMIESYPTFVDIFRGCLRLHEPEIPARAADVVASFCKRADLDPAAFDAIERLVTGEKPDGKMEALFVSYYTQLVKAVRSVDQFGGQAP